MEITLRAETGAETTNAEWVLITASIGRNAQAFATLYDSYLDRVYNYVYYRVGNRPDAEDLPQQVFLNAWNAIGRYKNTGATFIAWLLTIAHNLVVSFHRKSKETTYLELEPAAHQRWANPEAETLARNDRVAVRHAILRLKPEWQQVITMRFLENLDYSDLAAALGKTEGNIRVIQHRALAELQRLLVREVKP